MPGAVGSPASNAATANTVLSTFPSVTTIGGPGSVFVVMIIYPATGTRAVTDSKGNTYTQVGPTVAANAGSNRMEMWRCEGGVGGSNHTFTITTDVGQGPSIFAIELTGMLTGGSALDQSVGNQDSISPYTNTPVTTQQADEILVSFFAGSSEASGTVNAEGSGMTVQASVTNGVAFWTGAFATKIVSTIQNNYASSWTETTGLSNGPPFAVIFATFRVAPPAPPPGGGGAQGGPASASTVAVSGGVQGAGVYH